MGLFPVHDRLLGLCRQLGAAVWLLLWLIRHTTSDVETTGGFVGIVENDQPVPTQRIANDLGITLCSALDNLKRLEQAGEIERIPGGAGRAYKYRVLNSTRWELKRTNTPPEKITRVGENTPTFFSDPLEKPGETHGQNSEAINIEFNRKNSKASSRRKRREKIDPRHAPLREEFKRLYQLKNGIAAPWGPRDASCLSRMLDANPSASLELLLQCLQNRFDSEKPRLSAAHKWMEDALSYARGPVDQFGNPKSMGRFTAPPPRASLPLSQKISCLQQARETGKHVRAAVAQLEKTRESYDQKGSDNDN